MKNEEAVYMYSYSIEAANGRSSWGSIESTSMIRSTADYNFHVDRLLDELGISKESVKIINIALIGFPEV